MNAVLVLMSLSCQRLHCSVTTQERGILFISFVIKIDIDCKYCCRVAALLLIDRGLELTDVGQSAVLT